MLPSRYKAGILSYVLAVGILISGMLSAMIFYLYYTRMEVITYQKKIDVMENLDQAVKISLASGNSFEYHRTYHYDLYGNERDSISILKQKWGCFDLFKVASHRDHIIQHKTYLTGHQLSSKGRSAIYLPDEGQALSLAGKTKITGDCYLPLAGVQSAYINQIGYQNKQLIYGKRKRSAKLPKIQTKEIYQSFEDSGFEKTYSLSYSVDHSFISDRITISHDGLVTGDVRGNVLIRSSGRIVFDSLAHCEDVIVFAPVIEFLPGFEGNGQFLASDTIIVRPKVRLNYPSVLALYNERDVGMIKLFEKSKVTGWVIVDGEDGGFRRRQVYIEDTAILEGMVYCNGLLENYGSIWGNATVKKFLVNSSRGRFENYIFNGEINALKLDSSFVTLPGWFFKERAEVLQYLK